MGFLRVFWDRVLITIGDEGSRRLERRGVEWGASEHIYLAYYPYTIVHRHSSYHGIVLIQLYLKRPRSKGSDPQQTGPRTSPPDGAITKRGVPEPYKGPDTDTANRARQ